MEFNSQICTTREQSERLIAMGLKPETADMMWDAITIIRGKPVQEPMWSLRPYYYPQKSKVLYDNEEQVFIPAWSLHRLWELYWSNKVVSDCLFGCGKHMNPYAKMIALIEFDIEDGTFNKEYLK